MNWLRGCSTLFLTLIVVSAVSAQTTPREIPPNDNFTGALSLPIGTSIKIKDAGAATTDISDPTVCGFTAHHSLWYSFTPEVTTTVYFSTSGTMLYPATDTENKPVLGVYAGSELGSLVLEACGDLQVYQTSLSHTFSAGTAYAIQLGSYVELPYDPNSVYKLKTRVTEMDLSPVNEGFESPLTPDDWTLKSTSGDGVVCSDPTYPALLGSCAFKFEGSPGKSSKLTQTVPIPSGYMLPKSSAIVFFAYYRGMDGPSIGNAKLTAKVIYADGTPPAVVTLNLAGRESEDAYQIALATAYLKPGPLLKVKLKVKYQGESGVLMLDYIRLQYGTALIRQGSIAALPVPPGP